MTFREAILAHPDLTTEQHATLGRLVRQFGTPFAFSVVAGAALPTWQNIGTVSVRLDGAAFKVGTGERLPDVKCRVAGCPWPPADRHTAMCAAHHERHLDRYLDHTRDPETPQC